MINLTDEWKQRNLYSKWSKRVLDPKDLDDFNIIAKDPTEISPLLPHLARLLFARIASVIRLAGIQNILNIEKSDGYLIRAWDLIKDPWLEPETKILRGKIEYEAVTAYIETLPGLTEVLANGKFEPLAQCYFCPQSEFTHYFNDRGYREFEGDRLSAIDDINIATTIKESRSNGNMDSHLPFLSHFCGADGHVFSPGAIDLLIEDRMKYIVILFWLEYGEFGKLNTKQIVSNHLRYYAHDEKANAFNGGTGSLLSRAGTQEIRDIIESIDEIVSGEIIGTRGDLKNIVSKIDLVSMIRKYHHPMFDLFKQFETPLPNMIHIENRIDVLFPGLGDHDDFKAIHQNNELALSDDKIVNTLINSFAMNSKYCEHKQLVSEREFGGVIQVKTNPEDINEFVS